MLPLWSVEHAGLFYQAVLLLTAAFAVVISSLMMWLRY